jgi:hypothetical protein
MDGVAVAGVPSSAERNRAVEGITKLYTRDPVSGLYAQNMIYKVMKLEMDRPDVTGTPLRPYLSR